MKRPCPNAKPVTLWICPIELAECGHAPARPIERCAGCDGENLPANVRRSIDAAKVRAAKQFSREDVIAELIDKGLSRKEAEAKYEETKQAGCSGCGKKPQTTGDLIEKMNAAHEATKNSKLRFP